MSIDNHEGEGRFPANGAPLFRDGDTLTKDSDVAIEFLHGPEMSAGPLGTITMELERYTDERRAKSDNMEVYALHNGKLETMQRTEAEKEGYSFLIRLVDSVVPAGFALRCNMWSEPNDLMVSSVSKRYEENHGLSFEFQDWSSGEGDPKFLVVPSTPEFLNTLKYNIETIQNIQPGGGEAQ